jgi:outer membrane protein assembly factor BamB
VHPILTLLLMIIAAAGGFLAGRALPSGMPSTLVAPTSPSAQLQPILKTAMAIATTDQGSVTELAAVLPRDGKGGDLLAYVYHSDTSRYTIGLIDGGSHTARWQSPLLSKEAYPGRVATGQDMLFFTDKDQLFGLHLRDGSPAWQAALTVEPSPGCDECLRVLAQHVAVLEKDGTLQVFDSQNGQLAWSTRLEDRPNRLLAAGDRLVTITEAADKQTRLVNFLDPSTGKATLQLAPVCPSDPNLSHDERPDASSPFMFSADGTAMYTMFGFFAQCAQAWDLASGKTRWQVALGRDHMPSSPALQTDKALYIGNDKSLWALDMADGKVRTLVNEKEYQLKPLALHQNTLIVRAAPDWDSQRQELWGLDSASGERRWQIKLQAHDLREDRSSGDWELRLTPKGLLVIQALGDEPQLVTELFDPSTGKSLLRETTPLGSIGTPSIIGSLWGDDTAWLRINGDVYAIDLGTGKVGYKLQ